MRLVLDTNIVMDMLHFDNVHTRPLQTAIDAGRLRCFTDRDCLAELERVAAYPEFGLSPEGRTKLVSRYRAMSEACEATDDEAFVLPRCRDVDDQKFLVLAARCAADLLVTRDKLLLVLAHHRHKPPPCRIVTAQDACQLLGLG